MNLPENLVIFLFGISGITIISSQSSGSITTLRCYSCSSEDSCSTDNVGIQQCDPLAGLPCISSNLTFTSQLDSGEEKTSFISVGCLNSEVEFTPPTRNGCVDGQTYFDLIVPHPPPSLNLPTVDGKVCFCDSDLCNTENIQPASPRNCPDGLPPVSCGENPCEMAECPLNPRAVCFANYCNRRQHCLAEWFSGDGNRVDCGICPDGLSSHQCYVDPCYQAECTSNPDAVCIGNYCNRQQPCLAEWFNVSGYPVDCGVDHCAFQCDDTFAPVCGSDVQTYPNACVLTRAACRDPTIYQVYTGNCTVKARLNDRSSHNSRIGYVELSEDYTNWYMLCYDGHHDSRFLRVASVVCKELGYGPPGIAHINPYGFLFDEENFFSFNDEWCHVDATEVLDCSLEGLYSARVDRCFTKVLRVGCLPAEAEEYDVALLAKHPYTEGVVLIHINGQWGPICRGRAGDTVCRQLGLGPERGSFHGGITTYAPPVLGSLYCDSHNGTIEECFMTSVIDNQCDPEKYLTVSCSKADNSHEDDMPPDYHSYSEDYTLYSEGNLYSEDNDYYTLYSEGNLYSEDNDYSENDLASGNSQSGIFPVYLTCIVIVIIGIGVYFLMCHLKRVKAQQGHQNPVGATAVPSLSSTVNRQRSPPSSNTSAYHSSSGQQVRLSTFQPYSPARTQEADPAPPYPSTEHQSHDIPPYPPRQRNPPSSNASAYYTSSGQQVRLSTFQPYSPAGTQEADPAPPYPSTEHQSHDIPPYPPPLYDDSDLPKYEEVVGSQIPT